MSRWPVSDRQGPNLLGTNVELGRTRRAGASSGRPMLRKYKANQRQGQGRVHCEKAPRKAHAIVETGVWVPAENDRLILTYTSGQDVRGVGSHASNRHKKRYGGMHSVPERDNGSHPHVSQSQTGLRFGPFVVLSSKTCRESF